MTTIFDVRARKFFQKVNLLTFILIFAAAHICVYREFGLGTYFYYLALSVTLLGWNIKSKVMMRLVDLIVYVSAVVPIYKFLGITGAAGIGILCSMSFTAKMLVKSYLSHKADKITEWYTDGDGIIHPMPSE